MHHLFVSIASIVVPFVNFTLEILELNSYTYSNLLFYNKFININQYNQ